uniref:Uncharacterized protein n=1 Tax=Picea sitchensis TaxID=3332 RepID=A0A6B9XX15_PICSI|nr:hypothetical protein Q903MT_gene4170 [Picea sitchensis]
MGPPFQSFLTWFLRLEGKKERGFLFRTLPEIRYFPLLTIYIRVVDPNLTRTQVHPFKVLANPNQSFYQLG